MELDLELLNKCVVGDNLEEFKAYFDVTNNQKEDERISLNGNWKYIYFEKGINKDELKKYLDGSFNYKDLKEIKVPSHIELNKDLMSEYTKPQYLNYVYPWEAFEKLEFNEVPKINPAIIYYKEIDIKETKNKNIFIEINGFESGLYLLVNNKYLGYSSFNFERNVFDITKFINKGKNKITILLFKYSFASWYKDQDMWRMFGIFRDINLIIKDEYYIDNIDNKSILKENNKDGELNINLSLNKLNKDLKLIYIFSFNNKVIFEEEKEVNELKINLNKEVNKCYKRSDEEPNLYLLKIRLKYKKELIEEVSINIGFRNILVKEGITYLNGERLFIKGVNRHEFSNYTGRVLSKDLIKSDILLLKKNNFNSIRTSHYPNNNYFYDLCDKYGILVLDEASIETHGTRVNKVNTKDLSKVLPGSDSTYKEYTIKKITSLYKMHNIHPSIIIWSLGNESFYGENFRLAFKELKSLDKTRLIHYEGCHFNKEYNDLTEINSRMYSPINKCKEIMKKEPYKPFLLCEFEHSMGNSTGNFDEYMDLFREFNNYLGGYIWDYLDQGIYLDNKLYFGGDFNDYPNDSNFVADGLLLSDRKETNKLKLVKYFYSPIKISINKDSFIIKNNFKFKNTSKFKFVYEIIDSFGEIILSKSFETNLIPNEEKEFKLDLDKLPLPLYFLRVKVLSKETNDIYLKNDEIAFYEKEIKGDKTKSIFNLDLDNNKTKLNYFTSIERLTVFSNDNTFKVIFKAFNNDLGGLESIIYNDKILFNEPILPILFRPITDNDRKIDRYFTSMYLGASKNILYNPFKNDSFKIIKSNEEEIKVRFTYRLLFLPLIKKFYVTYTVRNDKSIIVDYNFKTFKLLPPPDIIGLSLKLKKELKDFSYIGIGDKDSYTDRYLGLKYGKYDSNVDKEYISYSIPQENGNHVFTQKVSIDYLDFKLSIYSLDSSFNFKYLPYSEFQIEEASRENELISRKNYLTISTFNKGVGGDDSWGSKVHEKYIAKKNKLYKGRFIIRIES